MIKKLRRRIILINMLLIGAVILSIIVVVNVNSYSTSLHTMDRGLNQAVDKSGRQQFDAPPESFSGENKTNDFKKEKRDFGDEAPIQISDYVIVELDENGTTLSVTESNITLDEETLKRCIEAVSDKGEGFGQLFDEGLMFVKKNEFGHAKIIFASNNYIFSNLRESIIISSLLFFGSMAIIFVISLLLSGLAVKPVKRAWEQQKQFVADASHELKTPLTVIMANNNIMMSHKDSTVADEQQWLESTDEEAQHMKKLIENMLFLAKSDADEIKPVMSDVDFSDIVEGCALNFEPVAFEKDIMIETDIAENVTLKGDATQLNQLAHILTDNAVKYGESGTTVTIRLKKHGDKKEFSVNNLGAPIPPEDLEHIFDRFYRAEKSRTTKGYGLGLSIAQRIAESMNGKITVESNKENGTTFTVKFN